MKWCGAGRGRARWGGVRLGWGEGELGYGGHGDGMVEGGLLMTCCPAEESEDVAPAISEMHFGLSDLAQSTVAAAIWLTEVPMSTVAAAMSLAQAGPSETARRREGNESRNIMFVGDLLY